MQFANHRLGLLMFASLVAVGCGGDATSHAKCAAVSGTITYKGQPVEGATVSFWADKAPRAATSQTDAKGSFRLTTFDPNDGAILGSHSVTVTKSASAGTMSAADMVPGKAPATQAKDLLPAKYADAKTSPLKFEVKSGANTAPFDLVD